MQKNNRRLSGYFFACNYHVKFALGLSFYFTQITDDEYGNECVNKAGTGGFYKAGQLLSEMCALVLNRCNGNKYNLIYQHNMSDVIKIPIAIADDHTMFRLGMMALLKNYQEIEILFDAANGLELVDKIFVAKQRPQVCIIDVNMPVMHGYDTAKQIKKFFPDIKMLALSMYDDEINIIQMLRSGANGYLLKDSAPSVLIEAIQTVVERGFYDSELITNNILTNLKFEKASEIKLTTNELEFVKHACTEMTYKEIAIMMNVAERTVDGYRNRLFEKLDVKSRIGLVIYALRNGIVDLY